MTLPDQLWGLTLDLAPKMIAEVGDHCLIDPSFESLNGLDALSILLCLVQPSDNSSISVSFLNKLQKSLKLLHRYDSMTFQSLNHLIYPLLTHTE